MITAHTPLTAAEVGLLGLQDRQILTLVEFASAPQ